jgi:adenylate cyclase
VGTEIERKFLVGEVPGGLERSASAEIRQGYVAIEPDGGEVRVRSRDGRAELTVKRGDGRTRSEDELEIDDSQFARLWPLTAGRRIEKTRHLVPLPDGLTLELDVYAGALAGLVTAEVEFPSQAAAEAFEPPPWVGRDVTDDPRYKNQRLATEGIPAPPTARSAAVAASVATTRSAAVAASAATAGSAAVAASAATAGSAVVAASAATAASVGVAASAGTVASAGVVGSILTLFGAAITGSIATVGCLRCENCVGCAGCVDCVDCVGCVGCVGLRGAVGQVGRRRRFSLFRQA